MPQGFENLPLPAPWPSSWVPRVRVGAKARWRADHVTENLHTLLLLLLLPKPPMRPLLNQNSAL
jgi:hypothetical protein